MHKISKYLSYFLISYAVVLGCNRERALDSKENQDTSNPIVIAESDNASQTALDHCGFGQTFRDGLCYCGSTSLKPEEAKTWACVNGNMLCYKDKCRALGKEVVLRTQFLEGSFYCERYEMPADYGNYVCTLWGWKSIRAAKCDTEIIMANNYCNNDIYQCTAKSCKCGEEVITNEMGCKQGVAYCKMAKAPKNREGYECYTKWQCVKDEGCPCGEKTIPKLMTCIGDELGCGSNVVREEEGYVCVDNMLGCISDEGCKCGNIIINKGNICSSGVPDLEWGKEYYSIKTFSNFLTLRNKAQCKGEDCVQDYEKKGFAYIEGTWPGTCHIPYSNYICEQKQGCGSLKLGEYLNKEEGVMPTDIADVIIQAYPQLYSCLQVEYDATYDEIEHLVSAPHQYYCDILTDRLICKVDICICGSRPCVKGEACTSEGCQSVDSSHASSREVLNCEGEACTSMDHRNVDSSHVPSREVLNCGGKRIESIHEVCKDGKIYCKKNHQELIAAPKDRDGYECVAQLGWQCVDKDYCTCNNAHCSKGAACNNEQCWCGKELASFTSTIDYSCTDNAWLCNNSENCPCGETTCPKSASCSNGACFCKNVARSDSSYNTCDYWGWTCKLEEGCACGSQHCDKDMYCSQNGCTCYDRKRPTQSEGYKCNPRGWTCENDEACLCGGVRCPKNARCYEEKCLCGDNGSIQDKGYACRVSEQDPKRQWICTQEEGCLCNGVLIRKDDECSEDLFNSLNLNFEKMKGFSEKNQTCGKLRCPPFTACANGQCLFQAAPQERLQAPQDYISHRGFPLCNNERACLCGAATCKQGQYCRDGRCLRHPLYELNGDKIIYHNFVYTEDFYLERSDTDFDGKIKDIYQDKSIALITRNEFYEDKEVEFFERHLQSNQITENKYLCAKSMAPTNVEDYDCISTVWSDFECDCSDCGTSYELSEGSWMCALEAGCVCGTNRCEHKELCVDNRQCAPIDLISTETIPADTSETKPQSVEVCNEAKGCDCGENHCIYGSKCIDHEECRSDALGEEPCPTLLKTIFRDSDDSAQDDNGACTHYNVTVLPYYYMLDPILGFVCQKEACPCGENSCNKGQYCIENGQCL